MGWWGSQLSGVDGAFILPYPTLTASFYSRPILSLKVIGDSARLEYPVDFTIKLYDGADTLLHTETVASNSLVVWSKTLSSAITQVTKMVLEITKWSHVNRQVKVLEFFTSIQEVYEGDDILMLNLLEEREVSQGSLPVGNISSNEIDIRLVNENRKFDAGNTSSPLYQLIKNNRRIKAWLGVDTSLGKEFVPLGIFWSGGWEVSEEEIFAQTTGRDRLELLRKTTYSTSEVQINTTLYDLVIDVLIDAGLEVAEYFVDTNLQQFIVPYAYFEPQSHREALRKIAEASLGQVFCDRNGIVRVEGVDYTFNKLNGLTINTFLQSEYPAETEVLEAYGIGIDDYFKKNNPSRQNNIANRIVVEIQPLTLGVIEEIYSANEPVDIVANVDKKVTIYFNHTPCINVELSILGNGTITGSNIYVWGAYVTVSSTINGAFTLKANGKPLKVFGKDRIIIEDDLSIFENGKIEYKLPLNPLVQTRAIGELIATKLLQYHKDPKRDLEIEWRGSPMLELGDLVIVDDYVRGDGDNNGYYYVTKNILEFDGGLKATLNGRRAL